MRPNTPQYKHLRDRISTTSSTYSWWRVERKQKKGEPAEVRRARAIVRRHERAKNAVQKRYEAKLEKLRERANEALLFKEEKAALAAVVHFEKAVAKLKATI
jgi:hypothetical protein